MSQESAGKGLNKRVHSDAVVYMGINADSRNHELSALRAGRSKVQGAIGRREQDTADVGGKEVDLTTPEGLDSFVALLEKLPVATRAKLREFMKVSSSNARDELAQFIPLLYEAEIGKCLIKRMVLSGHSDGYSIIGNYNGNVLNPTSISISELKTLFSLFPRVARQVEDLMLSACETGHMGKMSQYVGIFPNLHSIWAYVGLSPGGDKPSSGSNHHITQWDFATRGPVDHKKIGKARKKVAAGEDKLDKNVAIWTRESDGETPRYEFSSPEVDFESLRGMIDSTMSVYENAHRNGVIDLSGLLELYNRLHALISDHAGALGTDLARYERIRQQVLYLRHWPQITARFWADHGSDIQAAYSGHGAVPNFRAGSRAAVLAAIDKFPGDRSSKAYKLLTEILRDLNPAQIPVSWVG